LLLVAVIILDQKTDAINKPNNVIIGKNISETNAIPLYGTYGCWRSNWFYLSNVILKPSFAAVFYFDRCHSLFVCNKFETNTNCWQYHSGNSTVLQRHYHWYFDLLPAIDAGNQQQMRIVFSILLDYAILLFINMLREIIKDIEDVDGDYNQGIRTLPIVIGKSRTAKIVWT
jgi:4-hydroxybenzoate polyprenyltransferase